jgi:hypothetical protein
MSIQYALKEAAWFPTPAWMFCKRKNLVALPGMEPRLSGLLGRGVDAPKVTLLALIASIINRSKRKKTYRRENAWESAVNLHGTSALLKKKFATEAGFCLMQVLFQAGFSVP